MKRTKRLFRPFVATVALGVLVLMTNLRADILDQVLLKVNGDILTKTELEQRQVIALRQMGQQVDPSTRPNDTQLRKMLDDVTPQLMVNIVDEMLLVQRGKELGYKLTDDQFKSAVDNIKKDNNIEKEEDFQAALKAEGMTMDELRRTFERQMQVVTVTRNEVNAKITISEEEARRYYDAHVKEFTTTPTVTLRELLINVPAGSVFAENEVRQRVDAIRQRVLAGESFEKLVTESSDAPSKANNGLIGPLSLDDLAPNIHEMISQMKVGDVTSPLRTNTGVQILKLESMTAVQTMSFDQAKNMVSDRLGEAKQRVEMTKYLEKLRAQAIIEWKSADLQKAYDKGIEAQKAAAAAAAAAGAKS